MSDSRLQAQRSLSFTSSLEEVEGEDEDGESGERERDGERAQSQKEGRGNDCGRNGSSSCCESHCEIHCESNAKTAKAFLTPDSDPPSILPGSEADPPPDPHRVAEGPRGSERKDNHNHVTSDDHIVEIRELPGDKVKITPLVPARMSTAC